MAAAQTGTGKTAGFALPTLQLLLRGRSLPFLASVAIHQDRCVPWAVYALGCLSVQAGHGLQLA